MYIYVLHVRRLPTASFVVASLLPGAFYELRLDFGDGKRFNNEDIGRMGSRSFRDVGLGNRFKRTHFFLYLVNQSDSYVNKTVYSNGHASVITLIILTIQ